MRQRESDPLLAAAEVIQDSADRMESIYRVLLHKQSLVEGDWVDKKLLSSIEYHQRDLATSLETVKWQLEDFEREVNVLATSDKSQIKQNFVARHMQFIRAIRGQMIDIDQSMNSSCGNSWRNMNLNQRDSDRLALFLSGEKPVEHIADQESEDNNILRRFLDPSASSSSKEDSNEKTTGETVNLNGQEIVCLDHNMELKESSPQKIDLQSNYSNYDEEGTWDLEAGKVKGKSYLQKNRLRGCIRRMNIFGSLGCFLSIPGGRASRSFMKRLKDGEEQRQSPEYSDVQRGTQRCVAQLRSACGCTFFHVAFPHSFDQAMQSSRDFSEKCLRSLQVRYRPVLSILAVLLLTLLILCMLVW